MSASMTAVPASAPVISVAAWDASDRKQWDAFVAGRPEGTFCHLAGWHAVMADALGHECPYRVMRRADGTLAAVLPLVRVRSRIFGDYLVSMPFLNCGGPLGDTAAAGALAEHAGELARQLDVDLLELRTRFPVAGSLAPSARKITVLLSLPATAEQLWEEGFRSKLRSQIKRPMKEGMETRFGADQLEPFYEVFARNMRDLGTPVLPRRFFERIAAELSDIVEFGAVYHQGNPVAAGCGFAWGEELEMTWASSLREANSLSPNMLLYWDFVRRAIERGKTVFNFGRCTPGGSTHRFKLQWGGRDEPLPWRVWSADERAGTPSPHSPKYALAVRTWSHLPLAVSRIVGPPLARLIP
jgi:FemAB-related protein (PEP-CTERM system-associated)